MKTFNMAVISLFVSMLSATAFAQSNRTFVSTSGSDVNSCSPTAPCRSFGRAISLTNPGGEIIALTSGGYGPFTVDRSVIVLATGVAASITAPDGAIGVNVIAAATDHVVLRGLNITVGGLAGGGRGIQATGYRSLLIDNCFVTGGELGVFLQADVDSRARIADSVVRRAGIGIIPASRAVIERTRAEANVYDGMQVAVGGVVSAVDFVAHGNGRGVLVLTSGSGSATLSLDRALISSNGDHGVRSYGLAGGTSIVRISNSMVTDNGTFGLSQDGTSTLSSMNNNVVAGNASGDVSGTITALTPY